MSPLYNFARSVAIYRGASQEHAAALAEEAVRETALQELGPGDDEDRIGQRYRLVNRYIQQKIRRT